MAMEGLSVPFKQTTKSSRINGHAVSNIPKTAIKKRKQTEPRVYVLRPENQFHLDPKFVLQYIGQQPEWGYGLLSYVTFKRTYARRVSKEQLTLEAQRYLGLSKSDAETHAQKSTQTTEEFWQTCVRVVEGTSSVLKQHVRDTGQHWSDAKEQEHAQEMFRRIWAFKFTPPGRGLWGMGTEALQLKGSGILNNCGFVSTEYINETDFAEPFTTLMDYSMLGVGMGFDLLGAGKVTLQSPVVDINPQKIPDTREGWIACVERVLNAFVGKGTLPSSWDYSGIRKEGKPLKTFGGTASGPGPLQQLIQMLTKLCGTYTGRTIDAAFIVDVMNMIGVCVVAGNVRRSSEIALGSPEDTEFLGLKNNTLVNQWRTEQYAIATSLESWQKCQKQIDKLTGERQKLGLTVLDEGYATIQTKLDKLYKRQQAILKANKEWCYLDEKINAHPLSTHRWASNNTVMCERGKTDYEEIVQHTIRNGEPGFAWPEIFKKYGRLADVPNNKDQHAKGFNPCVVKGTRILTREGYTAIDTLLGKTVDVWNGEQWAPVVPKVTGYDQPIVRVTLSDGTSLECTTYHKWLLAARSSKEEIEVVKACDLQVGDALAKFEMPVVETGSDWDAAYTHGFFCGDGQVTASGSRGILLYGVKKELLPYLQNGRCSEQEDAYGRLYVGLERSLPDKYSVRFDLSIKSRLQWLAGLLDADGCVLKNPNSVSLQIVSSKLEFLQNVRLLLTTLGVQAKIGLERKEGERVLPDGHGGTSTYVCETTWRLMINATDTYRLVRLGLQTHRLDVTAQKPNRDARRFVTVEAVTEVGIADEVYCFEEPISHRGTFEGIVTGQCGEQTLHDGELCCLVETYPTKHSSLEDFLVTLKYAYRYAKAVTLIPTHNKKTNAVMVRNRRIGTSMAGLAEMYSKLGLQECITWWDEGYKEICKWDTEYSAWLGVNESIKKTSIKPGGTTPLLVGVEGGLKLPTAPYYMRTVRIGRDSPLVKALQDAGYRVEPDRTTPRTMVAYFPAKAPENVRLATNTPVWEQAAIFTALQRYWSDNMVSATLTFVAEEAKDLARILEIYEGQWKCVSFLPLDTHGYLQAPYIPCTKEQYEAVRAKLKPVNFDGLTISHDTDDKFCSGGICEVKPG